MIWLIQRKYMLKNPPAEGDRRNWAYGLSGKRIQKALQKWKVLPMGNDSYWFADADDPDVESVLDAFEIHPGKKLYSGGELLRMQSKIEAL